MQANANANNLLSNLPPEVLEEVMQRLGDMNSHRVRVCRSLRAATQGHTVDVEGLIVRHLLPPLLKVMQLLHDTLNMPPDQRLVPVGTFNKAYVHLTHLARFPFVLLEHASAEFFQTQNVINMWDWRDAAAWQQELPEAKRDLSAELHGQFRAMVNGHGPVPQPQLQVKVPVHHANHEAVLVLSYNRLSVDIVNGNATRAANHGHYALDCDLAQVAALQAAMARYECGVQVLARTAETLRSQAGGGAPTKARAPHARQQVRPGPARHIKK